MSKNKNLNNQTNKGESVKGVIINDNRETFAIDESHSSGERRIQKMQAPREWPTPPGDSNKNNSDK